MQTRKFTTNSRIISDHLTRYKNTFFAFCELINNSIQAGAKNIHIDIIYTNKNEITSTPIKEISIKDDGKGVSNSDFNQKILQIATNVKDGGEGIGRFGALQIGSFMEIETIGFDDKTNSFTKIDFNFDSTLFENKELKDIDLEVNIDDLGKKKINTFYKVSIKNLYHGKAEVIQRRNKITEDFLQENLNLSIFERYTLPIFNESISFSINGKILKKNDFLNETPIKKSVKTHDLKGVEHDINIYFYNIKVNHKKVKVFFQVDNSGIKTVGHEYTYSSDWYTPDLGTWYIYVDSEFFSSDLFRNVDFGDYADEELLNLKKVVKNEIDEFFKSRNEKFKKFVGNLESDAYYPFKDNAIHSSTEQNLFNKIAFLIEEEHKLIEGNNKLRNFIYPLLNSAIRDGKIRNIFDKVLNLKKDTLEKFHSLLEKTDLEDVISFSSQVADRIQFIEFLEKITYGEVAKFLKERKELHKIVEKSLWIFGENYNGSPKLWSDKNLGNILTDLHKEFQYSESGPDENIDENIKIKGISEITDLVFFNERITDDDFKEIMVVELKAPRCKISPKELDQIFNYGYKIKENSQFPKDKVRYKLLLISSSINDKAKTKINANKMSSEKPFLYQKITDKNIEIYIMTWAELFELNKRKLGYLSNKLSVKEKSVEATFEEEYPNIIDETFTSRLRKIS